HIDQDLTQSAQSGVPMQSMGTREELAEEAIRPCWIRAF
ncbi:hypothetical protein PSYPI_48103, partial [Pseudomonas syringae pv. pisi str. 1704B]